MQKISKIFFDCMETIIDMTELPSRKDYALWAIDGMSHIKYWKDIESYFTDYFDVRSELERTHLNHAEYDFKAIYHGVVSKNDSIPDRMKQRVISELEKNFKKNYLSRCYIAKDKIEVLKTLSHSYSISIVSNYKVQGAIEEYLNALGALSFFDHVVVSADYGYKKPNHLLYKEALRLNDCIAEEVLFVGDDYLNDYEAPTQLGFQSVFYDPKRENQDDQVRKISKFEELFQLI